MLIIDSSREIFQPLAANCSYIEIGVYRGDYAKGARRFSPRRMVLVDPWEPAKIEDLVPADSVQDPVPSLLEAFSGYYPNGLEAALASAYEDVKSAFSEDPSCRIVRKRSKDAVADFQDKEFDFLYLDGNHRYDFVLADLQRWSPKVSDTGVIILNDCYVCDVAKKQHISVLEAVSTFIKLSDWECFAIVNQDFTDVGICRKGVLDYTKEKVRSVLMLAGVSWVEAQSSAIHSLHHRSFTVSLQGSIRKRQILCI